MSSSFCLIGHPLGHSLSPFIHTRLFALAGRDGTYTLRDVAPDSFDREIPSMLRTIDGCNVTIPHKQQSCRFSTAWKEKPRCIRPSTPWP